MEKAPPTTDSAITNSAELANLFGQYADRKFVFVRPGGNAGDYLIYRGAEKLAESARVTYSTVTHEEFIGSAYEEETVLYLHGGGGYNPIWSGKPMEALAKVVKHRGVVIQGPQTFWYDLDFLTERVGGVVENAKCERLVLMTREKVSHDFVEQVLPSGVELVLDHDTALNLVAEDLPHLPSLGYVFHGIRVDKEATTLQTPEYSAVWGDPAQLAQEFDEWVALHGSAGKIVTNRLHSAILGSILGIPTTLCPNSYFKNRAVWEHSLQQRGVAWADEIPISPVSKAMHKVSPVRWLLSNPIVQKRLRRHLGLNL